MRYRQMFHSVSQCFTVFLSECFTESQQVQVFPCVHILIEIPVFVCVSYLCVILSLHCNALQAGFCAAFTAIKFLSSTGPGGVLQLSATITSCMWACRLA